MTRQVMGALAVAALAALATSLLLMGDGRVNSSATQPKAGDRGSQSGEATSRRLSSDTVLAIKPGLERGAAAVTKPTLSPLAQEIYAQRGYKAIYDRLKQLPARTGEEERALAGILERCAKFPERKNNPRYETRHEMGTDESRRPFVASLSNKDPNRDKRLAAFDKVNINPCEGFGDLQATEQEVRAFYERAGAAGDLTARLKLIDLDITAAAKKRPGGEFDGLRMSISDAQVEVARQAMASNDPSAVFSAAFMLARGYSNLSLRTGPTEQPLDFDAFVGATRLLACELGSPCGADSWQLLYACSMNGLCDAADYRDYLFFYGQNPYQSQRTGEYYAALGRARAGDWSYFTFHRGPSSQTAPFVPR